MCEGRFRAGSPDCGGNCGSPPGRLRASTTRRSAWRLWAGSRLPGPATSSRLNQGSWLTPPVPPCQSSEQQSFGVHDSQDAGLTNHGSRGYRCGGNGQRGRWRGCETHSDRRTRCSPNCRHESRDGSRRADHWDRSVAILHTSRRPANPRITPPRCRACRTARMDLAA